MAKSNSRHNKGEISTLIVMGVLVVAGAAILMTTSLNKEQKTTASHAQTPSCPYDSGQSVQLGWTETDANNAENRVPISQNRGLYDSLASTAGFTQITDEGILTLSKSDEGGVDGGVKNMMATMFGYKPKRLIAAYDPPDGGTYVLEVPTNSDNRDIKVPNTGYDIGGGYEAMVVFAAADRVTIHLGIHEYFTGTKTCANGETCSGGYWIYVKNICVDQKILDAYNQVKGLQEAAGADLNPIQLPKVRAGQILGKASGNSVLVGVRDNGQFISIHKPDYWGGVPEVDFQVDQGATPTNTSVPNGPTNTPNPNAPTNTSVPTPQPTNTSVPLQACMDIEQVTIDINTTTNKAKAIKIKRKTEGNLAGGVQVSYNDKHIAGPSNLPDTSGDNDELGFENQDPNAHFFGEYELQFGVSVGLKVETFHFQSSGNYAGKNPCLTITYSCKRLREDGYATCERSGQTSIIQPTNTPIPQAATQPVNQTATTAPTPTQKTYSINLPFIGSGGGSTPTPTPAAPVTFQTTIDLSTQTACSEDAIAYMSDRGIREPYICISL